MRQNLHLRDEFLKKLIIIRVIITPTPRKAKFAEFSCVVFREKKSKIYHSITVVK